MADLTDLQAAGSTKIVGSDSTGLEQTAVQSTANGGLHVNLRDNTGTEIGTQTTPIVVAGAALNGSAISGRPVRIGYSDGTTTRDALSDASGRAIIVGAGVAGTPAGGIVSVQGVAGGTALPVSQSGTWTITAAEDKNYGTVGATTLRTAAQIGNATGAADFNAGATGAQTLRSVANQGAPNTHSNAWFTRLTDGTDDSGVTPSGDLQTADIINVAGQARAQSVTTSAAEALGAATILANRKMLSILPTNGTVYWGFTSGVTVANGTPIFKNQNTVFAIGSNVHIFLIASGTVDCRIAEGS